MRSIETSDKVGLHRRRVIAITAMTVAAAPLGGDRFGGRPGEALLQIGHSVSPRFTRRCA
jgi:hypothetical protein